MANYARLNDAGEVAEVVDFDWSARHPGSPLVFVPAPDAVRQGWALVDGEWVAPPPPPDIEPAPPPPPSPAPPRSLSKLEFARLLVSAGGMTMEGVRLAREDPVLATMWFVLDLAQAVERDDADTLAGLDAMVATGHLTAEGRAAVLAEWPS
ncbi:hypothetical protein [Caenispirillum bisanense]|uniref:Uncharacterized protein n=1 Tax=Caenispirillum bisanense TaxID=414052 RepID=A0A286GYT2_9PROT|nr:hypothetical protein [Caenispirillum bisanense]SOE00695.1 hypothetical protein SAMN05421508_113104 [Caenispirillum bisanense]